MNKSLYEQIQDYAKCLKLNLTAQEIAQFCINQETYGSVQKFV